MDPAILQAYESGPARLRQSLASLTDDDMRQPPAPEWNSGTWTIQQVVVHLADAEQVISDRMKRVIAEDNPALPAFDETLWAANLHYQEQSTGDAVKLIELTRRQMAAVLRKLPEAAFGRFGTHSVSGRRTLRDLIDAAISHLDHHMKFIHAKRIKMGKEMW